MVCCAELANPADWPIQRPPLPRFHQSVGIGQFHPTLANPTDGFRAPYTKVVIAEFCSRMHMINSMKDKKYLVVLAHTSSYSSLCTVVLGPSFTLFSSPGQSLPGSLTRLLILILYNCLTSFSSNPSTNLFYQSQSFRLWLN